MIVLEKPVEAEVKTENSHKKEEIKNVKADSSPTIQVD